MLSPDSKLKNIMQNAFKQTRTIQIIRHGATKLNNDDVSVDKIRGWVDIPLSKDGQDEAERLGNEMKKNPPDVLVSSDLKRAEETAEIISKIIKVPLKEVTRAFRPWDVGKLAGEISKDAVPLLADYIENAPNSPVPEGESFNDFKLRFFSGLAEVLKKYKGTIGIVTHHRGERLMEAWKSAGFPESGDIDISVFKKKGEHTASVQNFNIPKV